MEESVLATAHREFVNVSALLGTMRGRYSSNPIDKICALALPLQKRGSHNFECVTFPTYDPDTAVAVAWHRLISNKLSEWR